MNSIESIVAVKLSECGLTWKYEVPITINGKTYIPDFTLLHKNVIIEVFGDFWHANPLIYDSEEIVYSTKTASEIWKRDATKKDTLEKSGYRVYTLWQDDIINNSTKLEDIINEIH
jgi:G:T-mismatch repair DNA endonuclease (very short patch repair protein)